MLCGFLRIYISNLFVNSITGNFLKREGASILIMTVDFQNARMIGKFFYSLLNRACDLFCSIKCREH